MSVTDQHTDDQYHDHMNRIRRLLRAFMDGEISPNEKRQAIASENATYYRGDFRSPATGELLTKPPRTDRYEPLF